MGTTFKITVFIFPAIIFIVGGRALEGPCGDWVPYKDEKCLKIFESPGLLGYDDAENFCKSQQEQSDLVSIGFAEKQTYLEAFLRSNKVVDIPWIGLRYVDNNYQWSDGSNIRYLNWANGSPKNDSNHCVEIQTDDTYYGQWSEVSCTKKNLVVCEKMQLWSQNYLQNKLVELALALDESKQTEDGLNAEIKELQNEITDLYQNPVPVGFIYVQLPKEKSPTEIWSWMGWEDKSSEYAGLFFRTVGGEAAAFGKEQSADSPRLIQVGNICNENPLPLDNVTVHANGEFSDALHIAENNDAWGIRFRVSSAEVRPRNVAIKIWRRLK